MDESDSVLHAVGLMYLLPGSELPLELAFYLEPDGLHYAFWLGIEDARWRSYSESKRWKLMYAYTNLGYEAAWAWDEPIRGVVEMSAI
ncbi:MAG: hypothetical protein AAF411_16895 [Myxococcota bacterium]